VQTQTDEYTRYELLSPESANFAICYEVTATAVGAEYYFNPIRWISGMDSPAPWTC